MSSRTHIETMGLDVTVDAINSADTRVMASKVELGFIGGAMVGFTINDKHLRKIVEGLDLYLKRRGM